MNPADDGSDEVPQDDMIALLSKMHQVVEDAMKGEHDPEGMALIKDLVTVTVLMDYVNKDAYVIGDYLRGCGVEETERLWDHIRELVRGPGDRNETVVKAYAVMDRMDAILDEM